MCRALVVEELGLICRGAGVGMDKGRGTREGEGLCVVVEVISIGDAAVSEAAGLASGFTGRWSGAVNFGG